MFTYDKLMFAELMASYNKNIFPLFLIFNKTKEVSNKYSGL